MSISSLATAPVAGLVLDRFTGLDGWQIVWLIAAVAAALSTWCFANIPDPAPHADVMAVDSPREGMLAEVLSDPPFVMFLAGTATWNIALHAAGPFFNVYLAETLDASALWIGVLAALPAVTGLGGLVYFGRVMDLRGTRWVLVLTGLLIPTLPAAWLVVTEPWHVLFINAFGGIFWAGYQLAALNMLMLMSPVQQRARYSAAYHAVMFAAAFAGPLIGGQLIEMLGFKAVFLFSAAGRLAGTLVMARFVREKR
jgi:predicted MFS family arabinose efflux permease